MEQQTTQQPAVIAARPQEQHQWLLRLVGDWVYESGAPAEPGKPAETVTGRETVRALGDIWILAEGQGEIPGGGGVGQTVMALGYDPAEGHFVGTWFGSMMHHLWVYRGSLDATGRVLTLDTTGPDFQTPGVTRQYQDVIEVVDENERLLTARILGDDGAWQEIMKARYRRT
jgi:hypothetical protein